MQPSRRTFLTALAASMAAWRCGSPSDAGRVTRYVRYRQQGRVSYGLLEGDQIRQVSGDLFGRRTSTGEQLPLSEAELLYPVEPSKVLALAGNYASHLQGEPPPDHPEVFYKPISCLLSPEQEIVLPPTAQDVHYEAECVIVIGKKAKNVPLEQAADCILGYTCGNDISERNWQNGSIDGPENKDLQWWRAKGSETFGPLGPAIAVGLDYQHSTVQLRLNGTVKQQAPLSDLIHKPPEVVSFISRYVTLLPGDVIYTGTPGQTGRLSPGDVVEVEIDGIGVLRNRVAA